MFGIISAGLSLVSGVASYSQGRKAAKQQEAMGDFNRLANLANGRIEGARARYNAQGAKFNSLIASEDLKVNALITDANRKMAKAEGDVRANQALFEADRIGRRAAQEEEDLTRNTLNVTRERQQAKNLFQRSVDAVYLQKSRESAQIKAQFAGMGVALNSGMIDSINSDLSTEAEKAILGLNDEILIRERAANKATTQNLKAIERLRTTAKEDSAFVKYQAELIGSTVDAQDVILELEAANLVRQADYMTWNAEFAEQTGELEARVLESGGQLRAASAVQIASSQASASRAQGLTGLAQGIGGGVSAIGSAVVAAKTAGKNKFLGVNIS